MLLYSLSLAQNNCILIIFYFANYKKLGKKKRDTIYAQNNLSALNPFKILTS